MGYGDEMVKDLETTINNADVDLVISATPIDLTRIIKVNKPMQRVRYELQEIGQPSLEDILERESLGRSNQMFVDEAEILIRSGKGGNGMVHFHREKYVNRGGPDGGDGGRGGDVIFEVVPTLNTLASFRHHSRFIAADGKGGGPNNMSGRGAEDLVIPVPPGTLVYDAETGDLLGDLVEAGQRLLVAKGGRGGRGNQHFATPSRQAPRIAEKGEPAIERKAAPGTETDRRCGYCWHAQRREIQPAGGGQQREAKDCRLSIHHARAKPGRGRAGPGNQSGPGGYPRAGRRRAHGSWPGRCLPAPYPAHAGVDPHAGWAVRKIRWRISRRSTASWPCLTRRLGKKPQVVAFNKMDMPEAQARWPEVKAALEERGYTVMAISALAQENLQPLLWKAHELLQIAPEPEP